MKILFKCFVAVLLGLTCTNAIAAPADADATATINVVVDTIMEWSGNFADITIAEHITTQAASVTGNSNITLYTNGDVTISADNTASSRLTLASDYLVTEYRLEYDGDGASATGGATVDYTAYDQFLTTPSAITHISTDGATGVTLRVRASNPAGTVVNAGTYTAVQTLTAAWVI